MPVGPLMLNLITYLKLRFSKKMTERLTGIFSLFFPKTRLKMKDAQGILKMHRQPRAVYCLRKSELGRQNSGSKKISKYSSRTDFCIFDFKVNFKSKEDQTKILECMFVLCSQAGIVPEFCQLESLQYPADDDE